MISPTPPTMLTRPKAARLLGVGASTLSRLIAQGLVRGVRTDAGLMVAESEIERVRSLPEWGRVPLSELRPRPPQPHP